MLTFPVMSHSEKWSETHKDEIKCRLQVRPEFKSNTLPRMSDARLTLQKQEAKGRATQAAENNPVTGL